MVIFAETERLVLRSWTDNDIVPFAAMNADAVVMRYFPSVLTADGSKALYDRIVGEFQTEGFGLYAVSLKDTGEFIGYVGLHRIGFDAGFKGVEIGWRLAAEHHGYGYATEAAGAVLGLAVKLGLKHIYSFTAAVNTPSERVMQKIGMTRTGTFGHPSLDPSSPLYTHVLYEIDL